MCDELRYHFASEYQGKVMSANLSPLFGYIVLMSVFSYYTLVFVCVIVLMSVCSLYFICRCSTKSDIARYINM